MESSHFSKGGSLFSVSSQTGRTSLNKANGKYALQSHHELAEEWTEGDHSIFILILISMIV